MSVIVRGMDMPERCSDCDFCHGHICKVTHNNIVSFPKKDCPLISIEDPRYTVYFEDGDEYYLDNAEYALEFAKMHNGYVYDTYNNEEIADYLRSEVM